MKDTRARIVVKSIRETLIIAPTSLFPNALLSGISKPISIRRVAVTAIWAIILFSDLIPLFIASNKTPNTTGIKAVGDGEGVFTQGLGMLVSKPAQGFGMRSWRYSMLVENGEIIKQFVEEGQNDSSSDNDPFVISDAKTMLEYLKTNEI